MTPDRPVPERNPNTPGVEEPPETNPQSPEHEPTPDVREPGIEEPHVPGEARLDPTRYGDWELNGKCVDF